MRADAKNLLDRLGKSDFPYREFTDRFSDLELWPIFEALLKDQRLFGANSDPETIARTEAMMVAADHEAPPEDFAEGFGRYDSADRNLPRRTQDVRAMLRHLSDLGAKGEL